MLSLVYVFLPQPQQNYSPETLASLKALWCSSKSGVLVASILQFRTCRWAQLCLQIGYLSSWSPYSTWRHRHPDKEDPLIAFKAEVLKSCNARDGSFGLIIEFPIFLILAKSKLTWHICNIMTLIWNWAASYFMKSCCPALQWAGLRPAFPTNFSCKNYLRHSTDPFPYIYLGWE